MLNLLIKIIILFPPVSVHAASSVENCIENGKIRFSINSVEQEENAAYCTNKSGTMLISKKCASGECLSTLPNINLNLGELFSTAGKPGFELCRQLHGTGQLLEFSFANKWYKLDRCSFADGNWFLDTDQLLNIYIKRQK